MKYLLILSLFFVSLSVQTEPIKVYVTKEIPAWLRIKRACNIPDSTKWSYKIKVIYEKEIFRELARKDSVISNYWRNKNYN